MEDISSLTFFIVGSKGSGKSVFIQNVLDSKRIDDSATHCKKMSLEGQIFVINLVEVQLDSIDINSGGDLRWPVVPNRRDQEHVDGVLALYDVTRQETIAGIPALLNACSKNYLPCVLVASKCDVPNANRRIDPDEVEQLCMQETGIESIQTSISAADTYKRCVSVVLRNYLNDRAENGRRDANQKFHRPRARASTGVSINTLRPQGKRSRHGRTVSESESSALPSDEGATSPKSVAQKSSPGFSSSSKTLEELTDGHFEGSSVETLAENDNLIENLDTDTPQKDHVHSSAPAQVTTNQNILPRHSRNPSHNTAASSDIPKARIERRQDAKASTPLSRSRGATSGANHVNHGYTFDELVDRLVSPAMSEADHRFCTIFLCLYRKFASPSDLLVAIWTRFENLQQGSQPQLLKLSAQLHHLAILSQWLFEYPGDFAHPFMHTQTRGFVGRVAANRVFGVVSNEMRLQLENVIDDDDTSWACSDEAKGKTTTIRSYAHILSLRAEMRAILANSELQDRCWDPNVVQDSSNHEKQTQGHSKISSSCSSQDRATFTSSSSMWTPLTSVEAARRQTENLTPTPRILLNKLQWHQFIDSQEEDIARELTRLDWILYCSIRPRDLVRHVSLDTDQRTRFKGLLYVDRMINHFNHIAFWAANMILLRDKAKHRAKALEKLMVIAWKLRQFNNYNAVGAIIAGINGIAIHRLAQTRELVASSVQKDFMRLEILMSTRKSHFAYRLAWENTSSERIPFLPLHRRDLVSAEEGNNTFVGSDPERINWRKFEIMGEMVCSLKESQGLPYPHIRQNADIQRLILECRFSQDEDELYERSLNVEGPTVNEPRKRFNWFQR